MRPQIIGYQSTGQSRSSRPPRWPYAVMLGQVLLFFRAVLFSRAYTIPWDFRYYHFPLATIMARAFANGEFPLWDTSTYCGRPFYAILQAQVLYPPTLAVVLLSNLVGGRHLLAFLEIQESVPTNGHRIVCRELRP